jgi:protein-S-isoprenylcysteine O-methyltransferase Ste14
MMCAHSTSPAGTRLFMVCFLTILLIVPVCAVEYSEADMLAKFFYALVVIVAIITIVWVWQTVFARVRYRKEVR